MRPKSDTQLYSMHPFLAVYEYRTILTHYLQGLQHALHRLKDDEEAITRQLRLGPDIRGLLNVEPAREESILVDVAESMDDFVEWYVQPLLADIAKLRAHADTKRKIAALRNTKGRTPAEVETAERLIAKLQAKEGK